MDPEPIVEWREDKARASPGDCGRTVAGLACGPSIPQVSTLLESKFMRLRITVFTLICCAASASAWADEVPVDSAETLSAAIRGASPGDVITLAPGVYRVSGNVRCDRAGTSEAPITVRAGSLGDATIEFDAVEGFKVMAPHWTFENLEIRGVCESDSTCEHAFHIVGDADFTTIRDNRLVNFNAHIKANGVGEPRVFPDDAVVERNEFFAEAPRQTSNPVTPIDVVGGRRWLVRSNFIHDFAKAQGNQISYAAFLKGNSRDGVFERNLVACEYLHSGFVRLGLSFGGGGTSPNAICEDGTCTPEHQGGVMRNNLIVNCPRDVGIYINKGQDVRLLHNTLYNTTGIDVRFDASSAQVSNNLLQGRIRERNGGVAVLGTNLERVSKAELDAWFQDPAALDFALVDGASLVDQGEAETSVIDDYCGTARTDGAQDIGALEYVDGRTCDTRIPFHPSRSTEPDRGDVDPSMGDVGDQDVSSMDSGQDVGPMDVGQDAGSITKERGCSTVGGDVWGTQILMALLGLLGWRVRRRC